MNWFLLWQTTSSFCRPDNDWSSLVSAAQTSSSAPPASPFSSELGPRTQSCRWVQCHSSPLQPLNEATFVRENRQTHTWHISKSTKYLVGILVFFVTNKSKPSGFAAGVCHHLHTECFTCKGQRKWMENETMWLHRNIREVQHFSTSSIKSTIHKLLPVHRPRPDHPPQEVLFWICASAVCTGLSLLFPNSDPSSQSQREPSLDRLWSNKPHF